MDIVLEDLEDKSDYSRGIRVGSLLSFIFYLFSFYLLLALNKLLYKLFLFVSKYPYDIYSVLETGKIN